MERGTDYCGCVVRLGMIRNVPGRRSVRGGAPDCAGTGRLPSVRVTCELKPIISTGIAKDIAGIIV